MGVLGRLHSVAASCHPDNSATSSLRETGAPLFNSAHSRPRGGCECEKSHTLCSWKVGATGGRWFLLVVGETAPSEARPPRAGDEG